MLHSKNFIRIFEDPFYDALPRYQRKAPNGNCHTVLCVSIYSVLSLRNRLTTTAHTLLNYVDTF